MAHEYATLSALKESLNISDAARDNLLNRALAAASRGIDRTCGQSFYLDASASQRTYNPTRRVCADDSGELLFVDPIGSSAGLVVESGFGSSWTTVTDYETYPDNALASGIPITGFLRAYGQWAWGNSRTRVRVTARWGWPSVPESIEQATLIQASRLFKRKDSPEGVAGSADWGVVRLSRRDPDVWNLIEPFVLPGF